MTTKTYRTNLRCTACLESIRPHMDALTGVKSWRVDLDSPDKTLMVDSDRDRSADVNAAFRKSGYEILGEAPTSPTIQQESSAEPKPSYYPLILILVYLLASVAAVEYALGSFDWMRAMRHLMGGFFLVFSFFKLLDLPGFANSYGMYDMVAARFRPYAFVYPFLELGLGLAYLANIQPFLINLVTLILMTIGTAGVVHSMMQKRKVKCACLGTIINLPVASVTLLEDAGMAIMAAVMLFAR